MPIATEALAALHGSGYSELRKVKCVKADDLLILTGSVNTYFHKQMAQEIVRPTATAHGLRVDNRITVDGWTEGKVKTVLAEAS